MRGVQMLTGWSGLSVQKREDTGMQTGIYGSHFGASMCGSSLNSRAVSHHLPVTATVRRLLSS